MADINLAQLLEAGVHFGHKAYRWNPKMFPYIYTERNNIHILGGIKVFYQQGNSTLFNFLIVPKTYGSLNNIITYIVPFTSHNNIIDLIKLHPFI